MTYQVLARKWRPRNFAEMVGQTHVLRALINALDSQRLHHAFLFTGTRGVGKTTIARILAKSLNCEQGISSTPCGECAACREIDEGRFVDLIEVDAASRTKVEDTRELLDNVQYAPTRGRFKVYLIDEVHMLSNHSFNALLKTLEEPPPHVKFLLATTDPQKLPVTILSRCLQFSLRRLPVEQFQEHLQAILEKEGISFEVPALNQLARAADGSMRDALSLLDQAIAFGAGAVNETDVTSMLGTLDRAQITGLLSALADGQPQAVMQAIAELATQAPDYSDILAELISHLHYLALLQQVPDAYDESMGDWAVLEELASRVSAEDIQLYYQIGLTGRRDLPLAPDPRSGLEMVLLRMLAFRPAGMSAPAAPSAATSKPTQAPEQSPVSGSKPETAQSIAQAENPPPVARVEEPKTAPISKPRASENDDWHVIASQLDLAGMDKQLVMNCALLGKDDNSWSLALEPASAPMLTRERQARIQDALRQLLDREIRITIEAQEIDAETPATRVVREAAEKQSQAEQNIASDPNVQSILEAFNGTVKPNSVQPINES